GRRRRAPDPPPPPRPPSALAEAFVRVDPAVDVPRHEPLNATPRALSWQLTQRTETGLRGAGFERARLEPGTRFGVVVSAGCDVVGRIRMEEGRQQLDLPPARPELELTAPVQPDRTLHAEVVEVEQRPHAAEPRRL